MGSGSEEGQCCAGEGHLMPRPVCSKCEREMLLIQPGVAVGFYAKSVGPTKPYQVWSGDEFECPGCLVKIIAQYGRGPYYEHFHKDPVPEIHVKVLEKSMISVPEIS